MSEAEGGRVVEEIQTRYRLHTGRVQGRLKQTLENLRFAQDVAQYNAERHEHKNDSQVLARVRALLSDNIALLQGSEWEDED